MLSLALLLTSLLLVSSTPRDESSGVAGVSHVTLTVTNLTDSIRFYTELLGGMVADEISSLLAFWVIDEVDMADYANRLEEEAHNQGFNKVSFMRPLLLANTAGHREANEGVHSLRDDKLNGLSIGYAAGPDGESLKFIQLVNTSRRSFQKHYCASRMVTSALLDRNYVDRCGQYKNGHSSQLYGINHISVATTDINNSIKFYEGVLGGYLIDDVQPSNLQSPALQKLLMKFKKSPKHMSRPQPNAEKNVEEHKMSSKLANAKEKNSKDSEKDVPRVVPSHVRHESPSIALNMRYILFGNIKMEIIFLTGIPDGMEGMLKNLHSAGSPAKSLLQPGNMELAFAFHTNSTLQSFVNSSRSSPDQNDVGSAIKKIEEGPLRGLEYSLFEGPSKESISFIHFGGESKKRLHNSLRDYGSVSSLFPDSNPWAYDGYEEACGNPLS
ncbi:uncharacterized protein [Watersipora subatra]|uniref:uncharacterized protein n=1 Tax=Watersipora subatra TaxID=2589382 RepID=UPI00355C147B